MRNVLDYSRWLPVLVVSTLSLGLLAVPACGSTTEGSATNGSSGQDGSSPTPPPGAPGFDVSTEGDAGAEAKIDSGIPKDAGTDAKRDGGTDAAGDGGAPLAATTRNLSVGGRHTCALRSSGAVQCWGANDLGQLGNGGGANSSVPVNVTGLSSGVVAISSGGFHTCALMTTGGIKCWGNGLEGELGDGNGTNSPVPIDVPGLGSGVMAISGGGFHTCALMTTGLVKCWGRYISKTPVDVAGLSDVTAISAGGTHTCARTSSGGMKCWGGNSNSQLGNGSTVDSATPVDVAGLPSGVAAVGAGNLYSCALLTNGSVKCWGYNAYGQLGNGTTTNSPTLVDVTNLSGVAELSTGWAYICARLATSETKCWGGNSLVSSSIPYVAVATGVTGLSAGPSTCVWKSGGGLQCWGTNGYGQLGNNSTTDAYAPVDVVGFP